MDFLVFLVVDIRLGRMFGNGNKGWRQRGGPDDAGLNRGKGMRAGAEGGGSVPHENRGTGGSELGEGEPWGTGIGPENEVPENLLRLSEELRKIDVMRITPIDALSRLYELKKLLGDEKKPG